MNEKEVRIDLKKAAGLIAAGIVLNLVCARVASWLGLPLYFDCIGTVLAAVVGGYMPAITIGFFSNVFNGLLGSQNTLYYAVISVLVAVAAAYLDQNDYFENPGKTFFAGLVLALLAGSTSSFITYGLYGEQAGPGIGQDLTIRLNALFDNLFFSQLYSLLLHDLLDKILTVFIVYLLLKLWKKYENNDLRMHIWQQRPLTKEELNEMRLIKTRQSSLRIRLILVVAVIASLSILVTIFVSVQIYEKSMISEFAKTGVGVSRMAASLVDGDKVDEYLELGEAADDYLAVKGELSKVLQVSDKIAYVYVYKIMPDGCHAVFDLDMEGVPGAEPGEIIPFDESFSEYLPDLLAGNPIEPIITDDTYGWLLTSYEPIRDSKGQTAAYACIDISMEEIQSSLRVYQTKIISLFIAFFVMVLAGGLWLANYYITLPINMMTIAADRFVYDSGEKRQENTDYFNSLKISTGDEIENLYHSFCMTIEETGVYIASIQEQNNVISKMQNGLIMVLADMVESRDACTGDHVRKTAAYCRIILEQLRRDGYYPELLSDSYIDDVTFSAPLHDVGKIKIPDAILNKPGKLTDDEFEIMKTHTTAGKEVIDQAIEMVASDTTYLKEARNLAYYHHEKYNGQGYPTGLKGEEIPLSARVMAVADVFDALVSRRSYKEPFSFAKAIEILEEGSGSHFDPKIVTAFLKVKDEAYRIMETNMANISAEELKNY